MKTTWIAGTRGSRLALKQTETVLSRLASAYPHYTFSIKVIKTLGDTVWDKPLHLVGGKGLFVREIEDALLAGHIDFAVHSVKDLPTEFDERLLLGAVLEREDPRDAFLSNRYGRLAEVPAGGRIGTSSLRRKAQLLSLRPDLEIVPLRGNVDTRLRKLTTESLDGIVLALAGVKRMGHGDAVKEILSLKILVPPSGQGAIGIEARKGDEVLSLLATINDHRTFAEISAERRLQALIGGGCQVPLGINAEWREETVSLRVFLGHEEGAVLFTEHAVFRHDEADSCIGEMARRVRSVHMP